MAGRYGLGLRLQIVVALCVALTLAFFLLGSVALRLSERQLTRSRQGYAVATAESIAAALRDGGLEGPAFVELAEHAVGRGAITGVELHRGAARPTVVGVAGIGDAIDAPVEGDARVRVWIRREPSDFDRNIRRLFIFYCVFTGGAILLFAYGTLTYLIVRPVEALTRASERMAAGQLAVSVPARGPSELSRLSGSFNAMAAQIRADRAALEARLEQLVEAQDELAQTQAQLLRSAQLASVGRLSAGVAHEIGNPLAAVLGLVELLKGGDISPEEEREFLDRIESETERIHAIIRDLLEFSRTGIEPLDADAADSDLASVVEDAVQLVAPQKDLRRIDIETRVEADLPRVKGAPERHTQVLLNLLLNAADALPGGGQIRIELSAEEDVVRLAVSDSGPGIDPSVLAQLFEPFVTTKASGKGTGLGLAVCHTIVDRLGGTIRAENPDEGGARFVVTLPVARWSPTNEEESR